VSGGVSPAPGPGATAVISVNGAQKLTLPLDGSGKFSGSVQLDKRLGQSTLQLTNPNRRVTTCGNASTNVVVGNSASQSDVTNVISATVNGVGTPLTASRTVFHAVKVTRFKVTWTDCPPLNKNESLNITLGAGQNPKVGTVDCGVTGPDGFIATCSVTVAVTTSVGTLSDDSTWTFDVDSCD
jgi:hypothetical protein